MNLQHAVSSLSSRGEVVRGVARQPTESKAFGERFCYHGLPCNPVEQTCQRGQAALGVVQH